MGLKLSAPPLPRSAPPDSLAELATRNFRLSTLVVATSRRRDVQRNRARILLLLLDLKCPLGGRPRALWYVPGAVARLGWRGLRDRWEDRFGEAPPSERTIRSYLGILEAVCAIQRQPGDFLPVRRDLIQDGKRPRYPDTLHVLESEDVSKWWAREGEALLRENPEARTNPRVWKSVFGDWRGAARRPELPFDPPLRNVVPAPSPEKLVSNVLAASRARGPLARLSALSSAGLRLALPERLELARDPGRLAGAAALLWIALERGPRVRNPTGWLLRAFRSASIEELGEASRRALFAPTAPPPRGLEPPPPPPGTQKTPIGPPGTAE